MTPESNRRRTRRRPGRSGLTHGSTRLTAETSCDCLSNPPRGICGERESLRKIEPLSWLLEGLLSKSDPLVGGKIGSGVPIGQRGHGPTMGDQELYVGIPMATLSQGGEIGRFKSPPSWGSSCPTGVLAVVVVRRHLFRLWVDQ